MESNLPEGGGGDVSSPDAGDSPGFVEWGTCLAQSREGDAQILLVFGVASVDLDRRLVTRAGLVDAHLRQQEVPKVVVRGGVLQVDLI